MESVTVLAFARRSEITIICNYLSPVFAYMPAQKISRFLSAEGDFQPILAKAQEIEALAKLLEGFLPPELAAQTRVANYKDGKLVLLAANGPVAAKLKLLAEKLCDKFTKLGPQVNSVSVKVQPGGAGSGVAPLRNPPSLSELAKHELAALHARLPESPLRKSLKSLLERRRLKP